MMISLLKIKFIYTRVKKFIIFWKFQAFLKVQWWMFWALVNAIRLEFLVYDRNQSRTSNIAFLLDWAQIKDLDFGLIRQNISIKKTSFHYQECPFSLKSGKLWLNSYVCWISITSNWFYSQQFSLPYSKNILSVCSFRGDKKKKKKILVNPTEFFH